MQEFLDKLPVFLAICDINTNESIYLNDLAQEMLEKSPELLKETINASKLSKYCPLREGGHWFQLKATPYKWLNGEEHILVLGQDQTLSISNEEMLTISAYTDGLTGIYNRKIGLEMLAKLLNELKIGGSGFTVCFFDLDDLKYVNDNFGHIAGDKYILTVVDLIKQSIRLTDIFARMGGDEFLIIFPKCTQGIVENIMSNASQKLNRINNSNTPKTCYSISYGILNINPQEERDGECNEEHDKEHDKEHDIETILKEADKLMYKMKASYKATRVLP